MTALPISPTAARRILRAASIAQRATRAIARHIQAATRPAP